MWSRNLKFLLLESSLFGLASGAFEVIFSLYLNSQEISLATMGQIFSLASLCSFIVMIILGIESDVRGRRPIVSASLVLASITSFFVPILQNVWALSITRITKDIVVRIRQSVQPTLVYESMKESTRSAYAKVAAIDQGLMLTLSALGAVFIGSSTILLGFQGSFIIVSVFFLLGFLLFHFIKEPERPKGKRKTLGEMYRFDISKQLKILGIYNLLHGVGMGVCHTTFMYSFFFLRKFSVDTMTLSVILGLHNFTFGIPMILLSKYFSRKNVNLKRALQVGMLVNGLANITTTFIPSLYPAALLWFMHDIAGAAIYTPANRALTQRYARDESRGKDVNMTTAFNSIGMIIGPIVAGYLAQISIDIPFIVGGLFFVSAALVVFPLSKER